MTPIERPDFRWNVVVNWSKNSNKVLSLYNNVRRIVVGSYWNVNVTADSGQPYGNLVGYRWQRDAQGHIIVDSAGPNAGLPKRDPTQRVLGNYNPDWVAGISNTISYKRFSFSFSFDGQVGGQVYSVTKWFGQYSGVLANTLAGRELDWNKPGYVVPNAVYQCTPVPPATTCVGAGLVCAALVVKLANGIVKTCDVVVSVTGALGKLKQLTPAS